MGAGLLRKPVAAIGVALAVCSFRSAARGCTDLLTHEVWDVAKWDVAKQDRDVHAYDVMYMALSFLFLYTYIFDALYKCKA